jgi:UDPglucose--hexose-1-phosphate uridylyltransferase
MSELRHDPLNRRWVIVSADRSARPADFELVHEYRVGKKDCPFCPGREAETPREIFALRDGGGAANGPGWSVRVVPNRYPALAIEGQPDRRAAGPYDRMHGIGAHEVIVESPEHELALADQPLPQLVRIAGVWKARITDLMRDTRFKYILLFKNHGSSAGATLEHAHTQIIAMPVTPRAVSIKLESARSHHQLKERCLICDLIDFEISDGSRILFVTEHFVAFCPYAARFPFEIVLAPRGHLHDFCLMPDDLLQPFAAALSEALQRLKVLLRNAGYNFVLHTAPNIHALPRRTGHFFSLQWDWHWHIEILPRLTRVAGFEWGTGFHINPTAPEEAARALRDVEIRT